MKKLTNTTKVLRFVQKNPNAKAKEVAKATGVSINSVYQTIYRRKKDMALTMSASPAVLLKYPPTKKRGRPAKNKTFFATSSKSILDKTSSKADVKDNVNHPAHYKTGGIETIDFIEAKSLNYNLGNVVKYITRAGVKDKTKHIEDLEKGAWYLAREIANLKKGK